MEDMNSQAGLGAAQQMPSGGGVPELERSASGGADDDDDIPELEAPEDDGPVDETGIDQKDIDLVMQQVNCSRAKAVRALKDSGGDLINAISVRRNNWIAPIRPARLQRPSFQSSRLTILGLPAAPIPLLLRALRRRALLLQTYGNIGCRLDFEIVHCLLLTFSDSIVPRVRRHPGRLRFNVLGYLPL
ncbi:GAL4 enhancer protein [Salix suchowensis]|nr:GAL4 enhancer protein [Salix suchowensis]